MGRAASTSTAPARGPVQPPPAIGPTAEGYHNPPGWATVLARLGGAAPLPLGLPGPARHRPRQAPATAQNEGARRDARAHCLAVWVRAAVDAIVLIASAHAGRAQQVAPPTLFASSPGVRIVSEQVPLSFLPCGAVASRLRRWVGAGATLFPIPAAPPCPSSQVSLSGRTSSRSRVSELPASWRLRPWSILGLPRGAAQQR